MCLQQLLIKKELSVLDVAKRLRDQRAQSIQSDIQYASVAFMVVEYGVAMKIIKDQNLLEQYKKLKEEFDAIAPPHSHAIASADTEAAPSPSACKEKEKDEEKDKKKPSCGSFKQVLRPSNVSVNQMGKKKSEVGGKKRPSSPSEVRKKETKKGSDRKIKSSITPSPAKPRNRSSRK